MPPKAWDALQSWYEGGPFLERRVINFHGSLQLELFPLSLKVKRMTPIGLQRRIGGGGGHIGDDERNMPHGMVLHIWMAFLLGLAAGSERRWSGRRAGFREEVV